MTPQELQILADAVKIGFPVLGTIAGTLIGGLSAYLLKNLVKNMMLKRNLLREDSNC